MMRVEMYVCMCEDIYVRSCLICALRCLAACFGLGRCGRLDGCEFVGILHVTVARGDGGWGLKLGERAWKLGDGNARGSLAASAGRRRGAGCSISSCLLGGAYGACPTAMIYFFLFFFFLVLFILA